MTDEIRQPLSKRIEVTANLAIIVAAFLLCVVMVKNYLLPGTPSTRSNDIAASNQAQPENKLSISGVDWAVNDQTLVLAISSTCHYCSQSAPFYQRLAKERGNIHMVAVLPQSVEEGRRYLEKLGVEVDDVKQVSLASLGVRGTPTLILVNKDGAVEDSWVGKLPPIQETEVLGRMQKN